MNGQSDRWLSGLFSSYRLRTMSVRVRPHLGVGLCLYLSVTLGLSQGQGEDTGEGSWNCGSRLAPPGHTCPGHRPPCGTNLPLALSSCCFQGLGCSGDRDGKTGQLCPQHHPQLCGLTFGTAVFPFSWAFFVLSIC